MNLLIFLLLLGQDPYPLEPGSEWTYDTSAGEPMVIRVVRREDLDGVSCAVVKTRLGKAEAVEWIGRTGGKVCLFRISRGETDVTFPEPILRLRLPLKSGAKWSSRMLEGRTPVVFRYEVSGPEKVSAGRKEYTAMRVSGIAKTQAGIVTSVQWYAPGIGIVKQVLTGPSGSLTAELVKVRLAKPTRR